MAFPMIIGRMSCFEETDTCAPHWFALQVYCARTNMEDAMARWCSSLVGSGLPLLSVGNDGVEGSCKASAREKYSPGLDSLNKRSEMKATPETVGKIPAKSWFASSVTMARVLRCRMTPLRPGERVGSTASNSRGPPVGGLEGPSGNGLKVCTAFRAQVTERASGLSKRTTGLPPHFVQQRAMIRCVIRGAQGRHGPPSTERRHLNKHLGTRGFWIVRTTRGVVLAKLQAQMAVVGPLFVDLVRTFNAHRGVGFGTISTWGPFKIATAGRLVSTNMRTTNAMQHNDCFIFESVTYKMWDSNDQTKCEGETEINILNFAMIETCVYHRKPTWWNES